MRAFLFERQALHQDGTPMGEAVVFNGIRHSDHDYIYREELESFVQSGVLTHLHVAKSRENPSVREYVQHKIAEQSSLVWDLLQKGSYVYVCGSSQMRVDVMAAFVAVVEKEGGKSHEEAAEYMRTMESEHRYRPDEWG
jgi:sulfite reductase alpha subunit-like flavoprotein